MSTSAVIVPPIEQASTSFQKKFLNFIERFYSQRLAMGATAIAIFALVVSLILYAVLSWMDVFNIGMSQRDQVLHIAIPMFAAIALVPIGIQNIVSAFGIGQDDDDDQD